MLKLSSGVFRSLIASAVESRLLLGHSRGITTTVGSSALRLLAVGLWLRLRLLMREKASSSTLLAVAAGSHTLRLLLLMRLLVLMVLLHVLLLRGLAIATHGALLAVGIEVVATAAVLKLLLMLRRLVMELRLLLLLRIAALLRLVALLRLLLLLLARESTISAAAATTHSVLGLLVAAGTTHVVLMLLVLWLATVTGATVLITAHVRGLLLVLLL